MIFEDVQMPEHRLMSAVATCWWKVVREELPTNGTEAIRLEALTEDVGLQIMSQYGASYDLF